MLIVPGTGLVTDAYGLSQLGPIQPVQVGADGKAASLPECCSSASGQARSTALLGRVLVKAALSLADYRSYRDDASRDYLRGIGFRAKRDPVYPDLVFSLPEALLSRDHARSERHEARRGSRVDGVCGEVQRRRSTS